MSRLVCVLVASLAVELGVGSVSHGTALLSTAQARRPASLLALVSHGVTATLVRLDPRSLQPLPGRALAVGKHDVPWSFSPDRGLLALGSGRVGSVEVIALRRLRRVRTLAVVGLVDALAWPRPRRLVVVESAPDGRLHALDFDPRTGRRVGRHPLPSGRSLAGAARTRQGLVLLLAPRARIGPAEVAAVSADGVRIVALPAVEAGSTPPAQAAPDAIVRLEYPGLAVDARGSRAFVVTPSGQVADVDLSSLVVKMHSPARRISFFERVRNWLEPQARADGGIGVGARRQAAWLAGGILAVSGENDFAARDRRGHRRPDGRAIGLSLIDTRTWSVRTVDSQAGSFTLAAGTIVAYDRSTFQRAAGITVLTTDGRHRYHLRLRQIGGQESSGRLYLGLEDNYRRQRTTIVSLATGTVRTAWAPGWVMLLDPAVEDSCWC